MIEIIYLILTIYYGNSVRISNPDFALFITFSDSISRIEPKQKKSQIVGYDEHYRELNGTAYNDFLFRICLVSINFFILVLNEDMSIKNISAIYIHIYL